MSQFPGTNPASLRPIDPVTPGTRQSLQGAGELGMMERELALGGRDLDLKTLIAQNEAFNARAQIELDRSRQQLVKEQMGQQQGQFEQTEGRLESQFTEEQQRLRETSEATRTQTRDLAREGWQHQETLTTKMHELEIELAKEARMKVAMFQKMKGAATAEATPRYGELTIELEELEERITKLGVLNGFFENPGHIGEASEILDQVIEMDIETRGHTVKTVGDVLDGQRQRVAVEVQAVSEEIEGVSGTKMVWDLLHPPKTEEFESIAPYVGESVDHFIDLLLGTHEVGDPEGQVELTRLRSEFRKGISGFIDGAVEDLAERNILTPDEAMYAKRIVTELVLPRDERFRVETGETGGLSITRREGPAKPDEEKYAKLLAEATEKGVSLKKIGVVIEALDTHMREASGKETDKLNVLTHTFLNLKEKARGANVFSLENESPIIPFDRLDPKKMKNIFESAVAGLIGGVYSLSQLIELVGPSIEGLSEEMQEVYLRRLNALWDVDRNRAIQKLGSMEYPDVSPDLEGISGLIEEAREEQSGALMEQTGILADLLEYTSGIPLELEGGG